MNTIQSLLYDSMQTHAGRKAVADPEGGAALTAQKIIPNPSFAEDGHERLLRTGDLGRWDAEGRLVYINRMDRMVKINGQRVEPGEIEAEIKSVPGVSDAAVKGFTKENGQTYLCAYYVAENSVHEDTLRAAIARKLPFYMMPAHFIVLDAMPVNANGKLDRLSLKEPEAAQFASDYAAPANETWKKGLAGITLCGVPAVMDFDLCKDREMILAEARKQNELGLQYAEYSFALENMSPGQAESIKIVYEHGLDLPGNTPAGATLAWDSGSYSSMLCLFQFLVNEGAADEPLTLVAVCQGSRYKEGSARRMTSLFADAIDELLFP